MMADLPISLLNYVGNSGYTNNDLLVLVNYSTIPAETVKTTLLQHKEWILSGLTYLPLSGGTVTGGTIFQGGLTANTISAATIIGLQYYKESSTPPTNAPVVSGLRTIAIGDGAQSLFDDSISIGTKAGSGTTGNTIYTISIGAFAGSKSYDSADSVFIGSSAGENAIDSSFSNFIGSAAGYDTSGSSESNFIGYLAGYQANSKYSNLIGSNAGKRFFGNNIGDNNIIIGYNISLPNNSSNSINLGGVLFGTGAHSTESIDPSITPTSNGKIGIGVVSPLNRLHVTDSSDPLRLGGLQVLNTDSEVLTTDSNGVIHKRTYDYVTGFTYSGSSNTFTITTSSGNTFNAQINQMSGLTINGDLTVTGNYVVSGDTIISGNTVFSGTTTFENVPNAIGDFLTLPTSKIVSRRTAHQVRDDIGYYGLTFAITNGYY